MSKSIYGFIVVIGAFLLTGCGVPQEEHDSIVAELEHNKSVLETELNEKITDQASVIKAEKAKVASLRGELDEAGRKVKGLQKEIAVQAAQLSDGEDERTKLSGKLDRSEGANRRARSRISNLEEELAVAQAAEADAEERLDMLIANMRELSGYYAGWTPEENFGE
jgi:chromosome segregation ATPase